MVLFPLLVLLVPIVFGVTLAAATKVFAEKIQLAAVGGLAGLTLFTTLAYAVNTLTGLTTAVLTTLLVMCVAATLAIGITTDAWRYWWRQPTDKLGLVVLILMSAFAGLVTRQLLFLEDGTLTVGILNAWGDLGWHTANIMNFAEGQTVPPQNPIFSGTRLTYPFLSNFLSAMLITAGASLPVSITLPPLLLIPCALAALYSLIATVTKSRLAAASALLLFFFAGGTFGWTRMFADFSASAQSLGEFLLRLPQDYTGSGGDPDGYHFLNPVLSLFLPQRSFLFGIPLALSIVLLLTHPRRTHIHYVAAGLLAGLLPLFHGHTVLALVPVIVLVCVADLAARGAAAPPLPERIQNWTLFALLAAIIGIPEILYYIRGSGEAGSFFRWGPGWTAGEQNLLWFWFKNTGFLLPLLAAGFFLPKQPIAKVLAAGGVAVFIAANLYLFAPWAWDNFKLLIFWLLLCVPLIGAVLAYLWDHGGTVGKTAAVAVVIAQCFTGAVDLVKTALPTAPAWAEWDTAAIDMASRIQTLVPPGEAVVTAPYHNNVAALAGRPVYLGFTGHVWSHGGSPWQREQALPQFYQGQITQLPEHQPYYVVVGPIERQHYPQLTIASAWELLAQNQSYQLYRIN